MENIHKTFEQTHNRTDLHFFTKMRQNSNHSVEDILNAAAEQGIGTVAVIDKNSIQVFPEAYYYSKSLGIKILYGVTVTVNRNGEQTECILIAKNMDGRNSLFELVTEAYKNGSETAPSIEWDYLENHSRGLLIQDCSEGDALADPDSIAAECEYINPISSKKYRLHFPDEEEKLKSICYEAAANLYGDSLPALVKYRLDIELDSICKNGFASHYLFAKMIAERSKEMGYDLGFRGSIGASLVAFLCGITDINPLPAHYFCPKCRRFEYFSDSSEDYTYTGFDLPAKKCPDCGGLMRSDGLNIPFEVFTGIRFDKEPDIDLIVADNIQDSIFRYIEDVFGEENITRTVNVTGTGAEATEDSYPGGIMIVPEGVDLNEITPVQYVKISDREVRIPHLDWRTIDGNLTKYDVFASGTYKMLRDLQDKTGVPLKDIPINDENVLRFFREAGASGGDKLEGITNVVVTEFPEYNADCSWKISSNVIIESFSDLMRVYAMQQGTGCMEENTERLMENGRKLKDMISYRDDIMLYLESKGVEHVDAYRIMESVRKGQRRRKRANIDEDNDIMRKAGVPEWYIEACDRISYLTTKAQAASYAMRAWRMAYYKVYYPDDFDTILKRMRESASDQWIQP